MHDFKREGKTESSLQMAFSKGSLSLWVQVAWLPAGMLHASRQFCLGPTNRDRSRLL